MTARAGWLGCRPGSPQLEDYRDLADLLPGFALLSLERGGWGAHRVPFFY
jgi:hypothetical protein